MEQNQKMFDLLVEQKQLVETKIACADRLKKINQQLDKLQCDISKTCIEQFGKHDYIEERESGMYGETFYTCSRCNFMR